MTIYIRILLKCIILLLIFSSCEKIIMEDDPPDTPSSVFEAFWTNMDERYSYFQLKNIDWDSIYHIYKPMIHDDMPSYVLWDIFGNMICELNDGHVSLRNNNSGFSRNDCPSLSHLKNFDYTLIRNKYLHKPLKYAGPFLYDTINSVGYMYYSSFELAVSEENIDFLVRYFRNTKGLIIDIRSNEGGDSENGDLIESRLLNAKTLVEYIYYKNGPGHNDFSQPQKLYISPGGKEQYLHPIAVLINRECFSSASFFASRMSVLSHVNLIGDTTSGGAGRPRYFDLPNGWIVRYSSNYALRADGFNFEDGVPPDHCVEMTDSDRDDGKDTIIEFALSWIRNHVKR